MKKPKKPNIKKAEKQRAEIIARFRTLYPVAVAAVAEFQKASTRLLDAGVAWEAIKTDRDKLLGGLSGPVDNYRSDMGDVDKHGNAIHGVEDYDNTPEGKRISEWIDLMQAATDEPFSMSWEDAVVEDAKVLTFKLLEADVAALEALPLAPPWDEEKKLKLVS